MVRVRLLLILIYIVLSFFVVVVRNVDSIESEIETKLLLCTIGCRRCGACRGANLHLQREATRRWSVEQLDGASENARQDAFTVYRLNERLAVSKKSSFFLFCVCEDFVNLLLFALFF